MPITADNQTTSRDLPPIECPSSIIDRVRQFSEQEESYQSGEYNEAQVRIDFINPMLEALGWDVDNKAGYAEAYRDVVYEDALKLAGGTSSKAPDYGFYIGGRAAGGGRKFFLEAKRPSVAIRVDAKPAFQLRRYAYSAELPLSILTNFKDFIVYDTRFKPSPKDSATAGAILTVRYTEYPQRWHEIASVFSRDAILRGAFDKFAQSKRKKGMVPLGESFLKDIETWRESLAKEIASNNDLDVEGLNFAVQRTIDRILFLRICEDRGIEPSRNLLGVTNGANVYARLGSIFRAADDRYNSGIFHFPPALGRWPDPERAEPPDDLTLSLTIGDAPLRQILRGLYDNANLYASYEFSVIPPEILGQVYERFLGKLITLKGERRIKIEEKPEVRKAGGVYYTPEYIVKYIVLNTVGKLLQGKTPDAAARIRIVDPASGSGSFLIGAYQFLLDWHLRWYLEHDPDEHCKGKKPALVRMQAPSLNGEDAEAKARRRGPESGKYDYRLSTAKRKEILLNSIYGVDIDPQAVEVTKLSLLLKVLEGESQESISAQWRFLHERALPDLGRNIKCGNSVIDTDFNDTQLSAEDRKKINKFNWQKAFPGIFKAGGFDAVIGNPPYVFGRDWNALRIPEAVKDYLSERYKSSPYQLDMFSIFMEQAARLCCHNGRVGQIVPNVWLTNTYSSITRAFFFAHASDVCLILPPRDVFGKIVVDTVVYTFCKTKAVRGTFAVGRIVANGFVVQSSKFDILDYANGARPISTSISARDRKLADRLLDENVSLGSLSEMTRGVHPYRTGGYGQSAFGDGAQTQRDVDKRPYHSPRPAKGYRPFVYGRDLSRYGHLVPADYVRYGEWLAEPRSAEFFEGKRIYSRKILADRLVATLEQTNSIADQQVYITKLRGGTMAPEYVLGILCSSLTAFIIRSRFDEATVAFPQIKVSQLRQLPIRVIDPLSKADKAAHDRMVKLVERMLDLHKALATARTPHDKERIPREIVTTDEQIDQLIYQLYGLTKDEIRMVEEATIRGATEAEAGADNEPLLSDVASKT